MNEQSDRPVTENTRIHCGLINFNLEEMIREVHDKDDRIQTLIQKIEKLIGEKFEENKVPGHRPNEEIPEGNYGQLINTTNTPPISFDISFNSVNNANRINEVPEEVDAIMKDGSDVAICSPGEERDNTDNEEEFKVQGQRRWRSNSDLTDKNAAKKKSNPVINALPSVVNNSL
ncbi:hypothetical protein AVEN_170592-1 [Araneus ventricosus]|uniref:Uncharacterized protein n=1 Tax=Araneus ventricosus TaxID=182803 RepID=A0A4Y2W4E4_ARAVE|nr:hypothetical protein AVEN_170592-1 [Araneus ventricosus]